MDHVPTFAIVIGAKLRVIQQGLRTHRRGLWSSREWGSSGVIRHRNRGERGEGSVALPSDG
jgi:hypothetical protein